MLSNETYKIIKYYQNNSKPRVIKTGLSLEQARKYCSDPETSSMTASNACKGKPEIIAKWHETQKHWFYGFTNKY